MKTGGVIGLKRRGTILTYHGDGTVDVAMDDGTTLSMSDNTHRLSLPMAFSSPQGAFIGGCPDPGTSVTMEQGQGEWFISGFVKSDNIFSNKNVGNVGGISTNLMADLSPGRILLQTNNASNRMLLDPEDGISIGNSTSTLEIDNEREIISHNLNSSLFFTLANREIKGEIKRDIQSDSLRNVSGSTLDSHSYDDNLWTVGMDPSIAPSYSTTSGITRNLPLVENREIVYEFINLPDYLSFTRDTDEINKYTNNNSTNNNSSTVTLRTDSRASSFGLNLYYPNHLLESIKGTGVDIFGNILDINRSALPLGKDKSTFNETEDKVDAFKRIRALHRKSLAYHFEINARKGPEKNDDGIISEFDLFEPPLSSNISNYSRTRSTFFMDVDKEGQFKLNVPASSETGNIALHTRYINSSVLAFENKDIKDPNQFILEDEGVDIYIEAIGQASESKGILLKNESDGIVGPIEHNLDAPMKLNNIYHDITSAGYQFTEKRLTDDEGGLLVRYMDTSRINTDQNAIQYEKIVSNEIIINGDSANAGGRSGAIACDGFLSFNIGANTVDRQSLWIDTAGGIVSTIGKDSRGISHCASLDGDLLIQIGGVGLGSSKDIRFKNQNDSAKAGILDIRVIEPSGQLTVVRIDQKGVAVCTYGRCEIMSEQDMVFKSNTQILMEAPNIVFFHETMPKALKRNGIVEL